MTELQMGLIGLGVAAVFGVFGYNKWQEMRQRKVAEAVLKPHHEDVLLAKGGKTEPEAVPAVQVERSEPEIRIEASEPLVERVEPVFTDPTPTEVEDDMAMAPPPQPEPATHADFEGFMAHLERAVTAIPEVQTVQHVLGSNQSSPGRKNNILCRKS